MQCQENSIDKCKFIDCFYHEEDDPAHPHGKKEMPEENSYLFSACIPKRFNRIDSLNVCHDVALGNDMIDYFESKGDEEIHIINKWKWNAGGPFAITLIIVISVSLCVLCGLSCFYNYRIHHG